ncbi:hypothetical protein BJ742DRAFT_801782 [Cladochytrium replicatum]|nr:hypothetical protein BJ742DRAFT_801782 [Cladochytrium replicatum]
MVLATWDYLLSEQAQIAPSSSRQVQPIPRRPPQQNNEYKRHSLAVLETEILNAVEQHVLAMRSNIQRKSKHLNNAFLDVKHLNKKFIASAEENSSVALAFLGLASFNLSSYPLSLYRIHRRTHNTTPIFLELVQRDGISALWTGLPASIAHLSTFVVVVYALRLGEGIVRTLFEWWRARRREDILVSMVSSLESTEIVDENELDFEFTREDIDDDDEYVYEGDGIAGVRMAQASIAVRQRVYGEKIRSELTKRNVVPPRTLYSSVVDLVTRSLGFVVCYPLYRSQVLLASQAFLPRAERRFTSTLASVRFSFGFGFNFENQPNLPPPPSPSDWQTVLPALALTTTTSLLERALYSSLIQIMDYVLRRRMKSWRERKRWLRREERRKARVQNSRRSVVFADEEGIEMINAGADVSLQPTRTLSESHEDPATPRAGTPGPAGTSAIEVDTWEGSATVRVRSRKRRRRSASWERRRRAGVWGAPETSGICSDEDEGFERQHEGPRCNRSLFSGILGVWEAVTHFFGAITSSPSDDDTHSASVGRRSATPKPWVADEPVLIWNEEHQVGSDSEDSDHNSSVTASDDWTIRRMSTGTVHFTDEDENQNGQLSNRTHASRSKRRRRRRRSRKKRSSSPTYALLPPHPDQTRQYVLKQLYPSLIARFGAKVLARAIMYPFESIVSRLIVGNTDPVDAGALEQISGLYRGIGAAVVSEAVVGWVVLEGVWGVAGWMVRHYDRAAVRKQERGKL